MYNDDINNLILDTDSYKFSHPLQYPPNTTELLTYVESRGGPFENPGTLFGGLQMILDVLAKGYTREDVEEGKAFVDAHLGPGIYPYDDLMYGLEKYGGKPALEIRAVPEGTYVPSHNVLMTIRSTDERLFWMTSWFETQLLRVWYPITVGTISNRIKKLIYGYLLETSDDADGQINFKLHDFGSRGVSSRESAAIGGAAHLFNFMGSDTVAGILRANKCYNNGNMSAFSIPASEHSTITTWGKLHETEAFRNMLKFNTPLVACVSDSYDLDNAVKNIWGGTLKQEVIDSGKIVVVRPDSGKPIDEIVLRTVQGLDESFGHTVNSKGYKVLNNVRVIQGDGIEETTISHILQLLKVHGYSADNVAFGMGGALLQKMDRDTFKFALKCCLAKINGEYVEVFKDPATDPGKRSKSGDLDLVAYGHGLMTVDRLDYNHPANLMNVPSELVTVYRNGEILKRYSLDEIRERVDYRIKHDVRAIVGENVA